MNLKYTSLLNLYKNFDKCAHTLSSNDIIRSLSFDDLSEMKNIASYYDMNIDPFRIFEEYNSYSCAKYFIDRTISACYSSIIMDKTLNYDEKMFIVTNTIYIWMFNILNNKETNLYECLDQMLDLIKDYKTNVLSVFTKYGTVRERLKYASRALYETYFLNAYANKLFGNMQTQIIKDIVNDNTSKYQYIVDEIINCKYAKEMFLPLVSFAKYANETASGQNSQKIYDFMHECFAAVGVAFNVSTNINIFNNNLSPYELDICLQKIRTVKDVKDTIKNLIEKVHDNILNEFDIESIITKIIIKNKYLTAAIRYKANALVFESIYNIIAAQSNYQTAQTKIDKDDFVNKIIDACNKYTTNPLFAFYIYNENYLSSGCTKKGQIMHAIYRSICKYIIKKHKVSDYIKQFSDIYKDVKYMNNTDLINAHPEFRSRHMLPHDFTLKFLYKFLSNFMSDTLMIKEYSYIHNLGWAKHDMIESNTISYIFNIVRNDYVKDPNQYLDAMTIVSIISLFKPAMKKSYGDDIFLKNEYGLDDSLISLMHNIYHYGDGNFDIISYSLFDMLLNKIEDSDIGNNPFFVHVWVRMVRYYLVFFESIDNISDTDKKLFENIKKELNINGTYVQFKNICCNPSYIYISIGSPTHKENNLNKYFISLSVFSAIFDEIIICNKFNISYDVDEKILLLPAYNEAEYDEAEYDNEHLSAQHIYMSEHIKNKLLKLDSYSTKDKDNILKILFSPLNAINTVTADNLFAFYLIDQRFEFANMTLFRSYQLKSALSLINEMKMSSCDIYNSTLASTSSSLNCNITKYVNNKSAFSDFYISFLCSIKDSSGNLLFSKETKKEITAKLCELFKTVALFEKLN